ncbi:MAG: M48 family metallopeptidase [Pseudodesulfovibrio sp.]
MTEYCGLPLTIKTNPRAKRVLVKLVPGTGLVVVVPKGFKHDHVPPILDEKRGWIERTSAKMEARGTDLSGRMPDLPDTIEFRASEREYQVNYLDRPGRITLTENGPRLMVRGPLEDKAAVLDALRKFTARKAREFILPRLDEMSRRLSMPYEALRVRRQKTRWGSCSGRGTLSVNAKLLFLPVELVDHLLLHELCHTEQLNHSARYWNLVAKHEPNFAQLEDDLKRGNQHVPGWFG